MSLYSLASRRGLALAPLFFAACSPSLRVGQAQQPVLGYPTASDTKDGPVDYSFDPADGSGAVNLAGAVMNQPITVYPIFYGADWTSAQIDRVRDFLTHLSGSPSWSVLTSFATPGSPYTPAPSTFTVGRSTLMPEYAETKTLNNARVGGIVEFAINSKGLTRDPNAVYLIMLDDQTGGSTADFGGLDYCQFAGYHPMDVPPCTPGTTCLPSLQTMLIINPGFCRTTTAYSTRCQFDGGNSSVGPNSDVDAVFSGTCAAHPTTSCTPHPDVDEMVNIAWHEISEAITNPNDGHGYVVMHTDGRGNEIADQCEGAGFGQQTNASVPVEQAQLDLTYALSTGAPATEHLGAHDYLLQPNWQHVDRGGCVKRLALNRPAAAQGMATATGDLDGNGVGDLVFRNPADGSMHLVTFDVDGLRNSESAITGIPITSQIYGLTDFDGDGKADFLFRDVNTNVIFIGVQSGNLITRYVVIAENVPRNQVIKAVGDFDGDGSADILFQNVNDNTLGIAYAPLANFTEIVIPSGLSSVTTPPPSSADWETIGTGQFDAEARSYAVQVLSRDLATVGKFNVWHFTRNLVNNTATATYPQITLGVDHVLGIVDMDRDGDADVVGFVASTNLLYWQRMQSGVPGALTYISGMPLPQYRFSGGGTNGATLGGRPGAATILWRDRQDASLVRWEFDPGKRNDVNLTMWMATPPPAEWDLVAN